MSQTNLTSLSGLNPSCIYRFESAILPPFLNTHIVMSTKKFPVPLSYFSMPLGLFALGLSWRYGAHIGLLPHWAAETLLAAAFVLWLLLVIAYIIKIRFFRPEFLQDLQDLVQCCLISAIPITAMLAGLAALPYQTLPAKGLILLGTAGQLAFAMYRAGGLWGSALAVVAVGRGSMVPTDSRCHQSARFAFCLRSR